MIFSYLLFEKCVFYMVYEQKIFIPLGDCEDFISAIIAI